VVLAAVVLEGKDVALVLTTAVESATVAACLAERLDVLDIPIISAHVARTATCCATQDAVFHALLLTLTAQL